jgi:hypothetical protein
MVTTFAEDEAAGLIRKAGFASDETPSPFTIAVRVLGPGALVATPGLGRPARFMPNLRQIHLLPKVGASRARFLVAHELGEMLLTDLGYTGDDREAICDAIAAALICPRAPFRAAIREHGREFTVLAQEFRTTQSVALLRYGECAGTPVALVTERHILVRGEPWGWPSAGEIRRLAVAQLVPTQLERRPITDARRRVALLAA